MSDRVTLWASLLRKWSLRGWNSTTAKRPGCGRSAATRLRVECLEDRRLLSVTTVAATGKVDLSGWYCYATTGAATTWGQTIGIATQVRRTGAIGAGAFHVQWYLSKTTSITSDSVLLSLANGATYFNHNAIAAGTLYGPYSNVSLKLPTALPSGWSGTSFYVVMKTDSDKQVAESNENNNSGQMGSSYDRWALTIRKSTVNKAPTVATAATATSSTVTGKTVALSVLGADDGGESSLRYTWSLASSPSGTTIPTFSANGTNAAKSTVATFYAAGTYSFKVTIADAAGLTTTSTVQVAVGQTLTSITLTPSSSTLSLGAQQQFTAQTLDQFGKALATQPTFTWQASLGTITATGLYTAPSTAGSATIIATSGTVSGSTSVTVTASQFLGLSDVALAALTQSLYADGSISRLDMIQILQSVGSDDGMVDSTELAGLKTIVSQAGYLHMAGYVQVLAGDVVNGNTANASYQGAALGNLAVGSTNTRLTTLINKWFYGTDHPTTSSSSYTYKTVSGSLFVGGPAYTDMRQGNLGDCYYIATLGALAKSSTTAITNMFTDNGDGTWTVRFFYKSGSSYVADYVTVDSMLPVSGTKLVYAGSGSIYTSTSNELWIPLAEKAYAQWNETGREGRNGTNTYAALAGGWMNTVNTQVLGFNCSSYSFSDSYKQTFITAITSNKAVTLGTAVTADGLYGSHAYAVIGYNALTDTFQLYNPWGSSHPGALTWAQLKADCSMFVIADTSSLTAASTNPPRVIAPVESPLAQLDSPLASNVNSVGKSASNPSPSTPATLPVETRAADACYSSWGTDSLWSYQGRTRRTGSVIEELSPLAADALHLL